MIIRTALLLSCILAPVTGIIAQTCTMSSNKLQLPPAKPTLIDIPISMYGARARWVIYTKAIEDQVDIKHVTEAFGGMKTPDYLAVSPQGKVPALLTESDGNIAESEVIVRYLLDRFSEAEPSFTSKSLKTRTLEHAICRQHDLYIGTVIGCLYKPVPPFGMFPIRTEAIAELTKQLDILEDMADSSGPYIAGIDLSLADATCFGTFVFLHFCLPKFDIDMADVIGPKLTAWWEHISRTPVGARIFKEINDPMLEWDKNGRWNNILHAGLRDTQPATLFDKILSRDTPSTVVFEDDRVLAFRDINPASPTHVLIIPKERQNLTQLSNAIPDHAGILGHMLVVSATIAKQENLSGYRLVINDRAQGGQEVFHLHMHLLGGRQMTWPPG